MRPFRFERFRGPGLEAAEEVVISNAVGLDFRLGGVGDGWGDAGEVVEGVVVFGLGEAADDEAEEEAKEDEEDEEDNADDDV